MTWILGTAKNVRFGAFKRSEGNTFFREWQVGRDYHIFRVVLIAYRRRLYVISFPRRPISWPSETGLLVQRRASRWDVSAFEALTWPTRLRVISSLTPLGAMSKKTLALRLLWNHWSSTPKSGKRQLCIGCFWSSNPAGKWAKVLDSLPRAEDTRSLAEAELKALYDKCFSASL